MNSMCNVLCVLTPPSYVYSGKINSLKSQTVEHLKRRFLLHDVALVCTLISSCRPGSIDM